MRHKTTRKKRKKVKNKKRKKKNIKFQLSRYHLFSSNRISLLRMSDQPHRCNDPTCKFNVKTEEEKEYSKKFDRLMVLRRELHDATTVEGTLKAAREISEIQATMSIEQRLELFSLRFFMDELYGDSDLEDGNYSDYFPDEDDGYEYEWAYVGEKCELNKAEENKALGFFQRLLLGNQ